VSVLKINNKEVFYKILKETDDIFNNVDRYQKLYRIEREKAEEEISAYSLLKSKASLGEKEVRNYLIDQYIIALIQLFNIDEKSINDFINFEDIQKNDVQVIFEILLEIFDISEWIINKGNRRRYKKDCQRRGKSNKGKV